MPTTQDTKAIGSRWDEEIWQRQNLDAIDDLVAEEFVGYNPSRPEPLRGADAVRGAAEGVLAAFPDFEVDVENEVAEGDWVARRATVTVAHEGEFMGIAPTGNRATFASTNFSRVEDGKYVEGYQMWDTLGLLQQLGVVEPPTR